jgi:hypothetical protein
VPAAAAADVTIGAHRDSFAECGNISMIAQWRGGNLAIWTYIILGRCGYWRLGAAAPLLDKSTNRLDALDRMAETGPITPVTNRSATSKAGMKVVLH